MTMGARRRAGFSLLELMVATAILAIALVASISVIVNSTLLETQAKETNTAKNAAQLQMQRLRGMNYEELLTLVATVPGDGTIRTGSFGVYGLAVRRGDPDGECGWFEIRKRAGAVNENILDLTVRIEWRSDRGRDQDFELVSVRTDRGLRWEPPQTP